MDFIEDPDAIEAQIADIYQILESDDVNVGELINPLSQLSSLLEKLPLEDEEEENSLKGTVDDCSQFLNSMASMALKSMGNQTQND